MYKGFYVLKKYLPISQTKSFYEATSKKNNNGFIGIRNPGCICYMNAMIQQFYFIPSFRYGILLADDKKDVEEVEIY
jgi:ubiquitin carboxyl-terminal hydrolase 34